MRLRLRSDALLLALAGGLLLFGGGVGCDPVLQGVDFRAASRPTIPGDRSSPLDWYMAFNGKKPPGDGEAQLPFALVPPFGVSARMGVFDEAALATSVGAEGCVGLRDTGSSAEHRLCVTVEDDPANAHVRFGGAAADCPGLARAWLDLAVDADGTSVVARYRCAAIGVFTTLDTVPSLWAEGERWNAFVSASGLAKGAQVAFDELHFDSEEQLVPGDAESFIAFTAFEAFVLGIEAVYEIEDGDFPGAANKAGEASGKMDYCAANLSKSFAAASDADKRLAKAAGGHAKLLAGTAAKYVKSFVKVSGSDAAALEALVPGF
jgi:hypothetical protein